MKELIEWWICIVCFHRTWENTWPWCSDIVLSYRVCWGSRRSNYTLDAWHFVLFHLFFILSPLRTVSELVCGAHEVWWFRVISLKKSCSSICGVPTSILSDSGSFIVIFSDTCHALWPSNFKFPLTQHNKQDITNILLYFEFFVAFYWILYSLLKTS